MGSRFKQGMFDDMVESRTLRRAKRSTSIEDDDYYDPRWPRSHRMIKESSQHAQIGGQAIIMVEDSTTSTIELPPIVQTPLKGPNATN